MLEEYVDCVRDGLVCYGGFVRFTELTREQRSDMRTLEQSNLVLYRARQRHPDETDEPGEPAEGAEMASGSDGHDPKQLEGEAEMEAMAVDVDINVDPLSREGELVRIVRHLRDQVNVALAHHHFEDAADIQTTLEAVLHEAGDSPNLTLQLARQVTGVYHRLYRRCRNRGDRQLANMYHRFVNNLASYI